MAAARTVTLVAATATDIPLGKNVGAVRLTFVAGTTPVYFRTDGVAAAVAGNDNQVLPPVVGAVLEVKEENSDTSVIKVISAGTPTITVAEILT